jgi:signal transduction histidine kinase
MPVRTHNRKAGVMTTEAPPIEAAKTHNFYARLWMRTPRELGFLLAGFPVALVGFGITVGLFNSGIGSLFALLAGVFVIIGALYASRGFAVVELVRLRWAAQPEITRPDWRDAQAGHGFWSWFRSVALNGHYWLALLHTMIVNFIISLVTWTITLVWLVAGLSGVTFLLWGRLQPGDPLFLSRWLLHSPSLIPQQVADPIIYFVIGAAFLATLPFVTRALTIVHWGVAYGMLGAWKSEALGQQVRELSEARGAASSAEGHSLRRLERDIHDGPQQRLVRLQMDLAAADRQLTENPEKARELLAEALQQSKDALEELRALSRGFAPPILLDRGLVAAIDSAATRSSIPTMVVDDLPSGTTLPQEVERNAYFVASEALTNATKHSGATAVTINVLLSDGQLMIRVSDDGTGGAVADPGHGLAGLDERMRGAGGHLEVSSPAGGPTVVTALLPLG